MNANIKILTKKKEKESDILKYLPKKKRKIE
jgi:hypothetical protein